MLKMLIINLQLITMIKLSNIKIKKKELIKTLLDLIKLKPN